MSQHQQWQDDPAGTIRLDESDIVEMESAADLFAPFPDESHAQREPTLAGTPNHLAHEAPTRNAAAWDLSPPPSTSSARRTPGAEPYEEVTAVRAKAEGEPERQWVDVHAVVDDAGRLRLPEDIARALQNGAIVEVRLAAWAVPEHLK